MGELRSFVDNYFRKLVEQTHYDEEEQEFEQKELKKQKQREEIQRIEEEKINKIKEEKQRIERELREKELIEKRENAKAALDGDLDAISSDEDSVDSDEYVKSKKVEKAKRQRKKVKKLVERTEFVSKWPPAKFEAVMLRKSFGNALTDKDIEIILSLSPDKL